MIFLLDYLQTAPDSSHISVQRYSSTAAIMTGASVATYSSIPLILRPILPTGNINPALED